MAKVLLAGESWVSDIVDHKGFDPFPHTQVHVGCEKLLEVLRNGGHSVDHLKSHDVSEFFPYSVSELDRYDVLILSDIGANSLLLSPKVFELGERVPNRLHVISEWVRSGGGLMMAGGYLSFQGFQAKANYAGTEVEDVLPVNISKWDDRVEAPQGIRGQNAEIDHPIIEGLDNTWPYLLGYQKLEAKDDAIVLASVDRDPLLLAWQVGKGRSVAFASDISPHWAPVEFMNWSGYGTLFNNTINWLAGAEG
ncbi:glutamine amidotransferase [Gleimia hominis]|uniref:glutamine amidotransferase n=1 Tax=Gleimia hominis TaxID=595468 RepID=UPI000C801BE6|nr:glutamine amidotransferase [Gleimia hominis]WIK63825.1 glutamine amidotransferase [Gleimia hominis]